MIISVDAEKANNKIHHSFVIKKNPIKQEQRNFIIYLITPYKKIPKANIIVNGERLKASPKFMVRRKKNLLLPLY